MADVRSYGWEEKPTSIPCEDREVDFFLNNESMTNRPGWAFIGGVGIVGVARRSNVSFLGKEDVG